MMKKILLAIILLTLTTQVYAMQERYAIAKVNKTQTNSMLQEKIATKSNYVKQVVRCKDGSKSFILIKDDIFYSDKYEKFLFAEKAAESSCKLKHLRNKKGAIVCVRKTDMYKILVNSLKNKTKPKAIGSCLTFSKSQSLKITNHFPFTSQITYYEIDYKGKKLYISSKSIYSGRNYKAKTYKKSTKKRVVSRTVHKKQKTKNKNHIKKKVVTKKTIKKKIENRIKKKKTIYKPTFVQPVNNQITHNYNAIAKHKSYTPDETVKSTDTNVENSDYKTNDVTTNTNFPELPQIQNVNNSNSNNTNRNTNMNTSANSPTPIKTKKEQYYTFRCVGTYGENRITVDNDISMTHASNSVWRRCQALKKDNEICKIIDCYKLIK